MVNEILPIDAAVDKLTTALDPESWTRARHTLETHRGLRERSSRPIRGGCRSSWQTQVNLGAEEKMVPFR